jgi:hypothetical protein
MVGNLRPPRQRRYRRETVLREPQVHRGDPGAEQCSGSHRLADVVQDRQHCGRPADRHDGVDDRAGTE